MSSLTICDQRSNRVFVQRVYQNCTWTELRTLQETFQWETTNDDDFHFKVNEMGGFVAIARHALIFTFYVIGECDYASLLPHVAFLEALADAVRHYAWLLRRPKSLNKEDEDEDDLSSDSDESDTESRFLEWPRMQHASIKVDFWSHVGLVVDAMIHDGVVQYTSPAILQQVLEWDQNDTSKAPPRTRAVSEGATHELTEAMQSLFRRVWKQPSKEMKQEQIEVFIDVEEQLFVYISQNNKILRSSATGQVFIRTTGVDNERAAVLLLSLNQGENSPLSVYAASASVTRLESGQWQYPLNHEMKQRILTFSSPISIVPIRVECHAQEVSIPATDMKQWTVSVVVQCQFSERARSVIVTILLPHETLSVLSSIEHASIGQFVDRLKDRLIWTMDRPRGGSQHTLRFNIQLPLLESVPFGPLSVAFSVPGWLASKASVKAKVIQSTDGLKPLRSVERWLKMRCSSSDMTFSLPPLSSSVRDTSSDVATPISMSHHSAVNDPSLLFASSP